MIMNDNNLNIISNIVKTIIDGVIDNRIDILDLVETKNDSFECALCAVLDLCTLKEYALILYNNQFHRILLKVAILTKRTRTRELSIGALARMAFHWECGIGPTLLEDTDLFKLCKSILLNEKDTKVLLETTRLLNTFLSCSIDKHHTVIEHQHLTDLLTHISTSPLIFQNYTFIICNTHHSSLLLKSLECITHIIVYINAVTRSISKRIDKLQSHLGSIEDGHRLMNKSDAILLVHWGAKILEEENNKSNIKFNKKFIKRIMHLLWALMAYGMVNVNDCGPEISFGLEQSMSRLVSYIQDDDIDSKLEDEDILNLSQSLDKKLSMAI